MQNLVLIGMPGCGKSTVGVLLAKTLGYSFLDTDLVIQRRERRQLYEIIRDRGMEAFLAVECDAVLSVGPLSETVIATGGSVVLEPTAMERLCRLGTVVYLQLPLSDIEHRVSNIKTRGIAMGPGEGLADVYAARAPLYTAYADVTVQAAGLTAEETVEAIVRALREEK